MTIHPDLMRERGFNFENEADLYYYIDNTLYYLRTHNKNYTREQEYAIDDLGVLWNCITID